jgi:hypothetical protein
MQSKDSAQAESASRQAPQNCGRCALLVILTVSVPRRAAWSGTRQFPSPASDQLNAAELGVASAPAPRTCAYSPSPWCAVAAALALFEASWNSSRSNRMCTMSVVAPRWPASRARTVSQDCWFRGIGGGKGIGQGPGSG